jgi:hypothetical protein
MTNLGTRIEMEIRKLVDDWMVVVRWSVGNVGIVILQFCLLEDHLVCYSGPRRLEHCPHCRICLKEVGMIVLWSCLHRIISLLDEVMLKTWLVFWRWILSNSCDLLAGN